MRWFRRYIEKIATEVAEKLIKEHDMARREQMTIGDLKVEGTLETEGTVNFDTATVIELTGYTINAENLIASGPDPEDHGIIMTPNYIVLQNLPISDPGEVGQLWRDGAILKISI